jgi:transposase InsO family protein
MSRQNYYRQRRQRQRAVVDGALIVQLVQAERQLQPRLGTRKLHWLLRTTLVAAGVKVGRDRLFEVLRQGGLLLAPLPREVVRTTNSYHCLPVFKNLVKGLKLQRPHEAWVSDLTYLRTEEGFLYLALVTDKFSRKIVGHHCGDTLEAIGCVQALGMALKGLPAGARPIHHSDQGSQYCCHEYVNALAARGLTISMTEHDHCAENALAERMNGILKAEYGLGQKMRHKTQGRELVEQAVHLYNNRRPHTALDYQTPSAVHDRTEKPPEPPDRPAQEIATVAPLGGSAPARRLACAPPPSGATNLQGQTHNPQEN